MNSALLEGFHGRNHVVERHRAAGEMPYSLHVFNRDALRLPLRDLRLVQAERLGQFRAAALVGFEPCLDVHAHSLDAMQLVGQEEVELNIVNKAVNQLSLPTVMEARRERFIAYFDRQWKAQGGRTAFIAKTGMPKARVSQLFDPRVPFGEIAARRLAERLGLPENYFEMTENGLSRKAIELARMFDAVPNGPEKERFYATVTVSLESMAALAGKAAAPIPSRLPSLEPAQGQ